MKQSSEVATGAEQVNILNIRNKSMIIEQLKKKLMFKEVYSNLNDFNEAYLFYEGVKKLMKNDILEAGNHFIFIYSKLIGGSGKPPESDEEYEEEDYDQDYDEDYDDENEISKEEHDELFTDYMFICKANDQLKYEWWWHVEYITLLSLIKEMIEENVEIEITELEYILLVEQEGDERKYVLRKNPFYLGEEFEEPTDVREIPVEEFAYMVNNGRNI
jgi:hypothetical protein